MSASAERRLRRQQQKHGNGSAPANNPLGQLQKVLGDLQKIGGLGQAAQGVEGLVAELTGLRDDLKQALGRVGQYEQELERQRAVFLRFLCQPDLLLGPGDYMEKFLAAEQRYRAEYDAMLVLVRLLTWAKEAP